MKRCRARHRCDGESGTLLLETLLALALSLLVLAATLPALIWCRAAASGLSRRAVAGDGLRLVAERLARDIRHAGFGLDGEAEPLAVDAADGSIHIAFLEAGFDGGLAVTEPAPPGQTHLILAAVGALQPGDEVVLRDRSGGSFASRVTARDAAGRRIDLQDPLPFPALPQAGARLYRIVRRQWRLGPAGLTRDGEPALDPPVRLQAIPLEATAAEAALIWVLRGAGDTAWSRGTTVATAVHLAAGDAGGTAAMVRPDRFATLNRLIRVRAPAVPAAASPLP